MARCFAYRYLRPHGRHPPGLPNIIVERASDHFPLLFLGFITVGGEKSLASLESAAAKAGRPTDRTQNDRGETEVMVIFKHGSIAVR